MKLYQANLSPFAARVRIQLRAKGIDDIELLEPPGGLGSDEYRALTAASTFISAHRHGGEHDAPAMALTNRSIHLNRLLKSRKHLGRTAGSKF